MTLVVLAASLPALLTVCLQALRLSTCIAYCLPAGIAAVNLELDDNMSGSTIHSFAGIGHGQDNVSFILERISRGKREHTVGQGPTFGVRVQQLLWTVINGCCCMQAAYRWRHCHVLIIDEISMLSADLFSKLDQLGRHMRNRVNEPFGGIQVPAYLLQALYACLLCPWWADPSLPFPRSLCVGTFASCHPCHPTPTARPATPTAP